MSQYKDYSKLSRKVLNGHVFFRTWIWTRAQMEWKRRSLRQRRRKLLAHGPEHAQGHALGQFHFFLKPHFVAEFNKCT